VAIDSTRQMSRGAAKDSFAPIGAHPTPAIKTTACRPRLHSFGPAGL